MKVIFIPDYSMGNPYQRDLADSLFKEGVTVSFGNIFSTMQMPRTFQNWRKADILHLHWQHPFLLDNSRIKTIIKSSSFICGLMTLKLFGVRIVWTIHNITSHGGRFKSLELFFCKLLARLCDRIIAHGQSAKSAIMNTYGLSRNSKVVVIPHGNYISSYENSIEQTQARKLLGFDSEDMIFLHFGQIRPYKGVTELIEAFKELHTPRAKLLIAGQPQNSGAAEALLEKCEDNSKIRAIFGFVPDNEIQIYMNASDIVVLPYKGILTSGATILAMSFGKPVIAPAMGCIPDVMDDKGGLLYDPSNEAGLLGAMQLALSADLAEMGKHNLRLAEKLNWDEIAKQTLQVYEACLANEK